MQEWTNPQRMSAYQPVQQPARKVVTYTILCFSLAGLIFGFATGGFWGRTAQSSANTHPTVSPTTVAHTTTPVVTATKEPTDVPLDTPIITRAAGLEKADGTTPYTFSAQPVYKGTTKPIDVAGVTCRLWLAQNYQTADAALAGPDGKYTLLKNINNLNQPFPSSIEIAGAMSFPDNNQVQPCNANGNTTWTYTLSPLLQPGTYYIYILADWKGVRYHAASREIQITA